MVAKTCADKSDKFNISLGEFQNDWTQYEKTKLKLKEQVETFDDSLKRVREVRIGVERPGG